MKKYKERIAITIFFNGYDSTFPYEVEVPSKFDEWSEKKQDEYIENYLEKHDDEIKQDIVISRSYRL